METSDPGDVKSCEITTLDADGSIVKVTAQPPMQPDPTIKGIVQPARFNREL